MNKLCVFIFLDRKHDLLIQEQDWEHLCATFPFAKMGIVLILPHKAIGTGKVLKFMMYLRDFWLDIQSAIPICQISLSLNKSFSVREGHDKIPRNVYDIFVIHRKQHPRTLLLY